MARVSIYVPEDLKARMDEVPEGEINWSELARPVFLSVVTTYEHRKGNDMSTAIERLKASKAKYEQEEADHGEESGRKWALDQADYAELLRVSRINLEDLQYGGALNELRAAIDPENELESDELPYDLDTDDGFAYAFILGAQKAFEEVAAEL